MNDVNPDKPTISDKRRIDPETGEAREHESLPGTEPTNDKDEDVTTANTSKTDSKVTDLTDTLQRLQADFSNYKKRVEKERLAILDTSKAVLVAELIPVLDDIDLAEAHGDLEQEPLKSISDKLKNIVKSQKVETFGKVGDKFDPNIHEAVQHTGTGDDLVVDNVLRVGYKLGDKILRTAMVTVGDNDSDASDN